MQHDHRVNRLTPKRGGGGEGVGHRHHPTKNQKNEGQTRNNRSGHRSAPIQSQEKELPSTPVLVRLRDLQGVQTGPRETVGPRSTPAGRHGSKRSGLAAHRSGKQASMARKPMSLKRDHGILLLQGVRSEALRALPLCCFVPGDWLASVRFCDAGWRLMRDDGHVPAGDIPRGLQ